MSESTGVRLSKVMSERGLCSRREADELISKGLVKVDGMVVSQLGTRVSGDVKIEILAVGQRKLDEKVTILLNKPKGYVSSQPEDGYTAAVELMKKSQRPLPHRASKTGSPHRRLRCAGSAAQSVRTVQLRHSASNREARRWRA